MARLFVAVWPPDDVVSALTELHRKDERGIRFVSPENWHVTLRFLGDTHPGDVIDALDGASWPTACARLGPAVDVLAERALVVPVAGVDVLAERAGQATRHLGEPVRRRFTGHLTLARIGRRAVHMPRVLGTLVDETFDVAEVALVQSRLHRDGARYETLRTWPVG